MATPIYAIDRDGRKIPDAPLGGALVGANMPAIVQGQINSVSAGALNSDAGGAVEIALNANVGAVAIQIAGSPAFSATLQFEAMLQDEQSWFAVYPSPVAGGAAASSTTAAGQWAISNPGWKKLRTRCSAYTSGLAVVTLGASVGTGPESSGAGGGEVVTVPATNTQVLAITTGGAGYVAGNVVSGILSLTNVNLASGRRVVLRSVQINDKNGNAVALNIYFFKSTPAAGTYTDQVGIAWGAGDSAKKVGQLKIAASDWLTDNSQSSVNVGNLGEKMSVAATTLFMLIIAEGGATLTNGNLTAELNFDCE